MSAGSRKPITATVHTKDGRQLQGVYLIWMEDNNEVVSVGSSGMVFGLSPGTTKVTAGDNQAMAASPTRIIVLKADEKRKDGGTGFPRILLSEIDDDPLGEEPPVFSQAEPPVHQRPQDVDHNIWWINMASPLARYYFDSARPGPFCLSRHALSPYRKVWEQFVGYPPKVVNHIQLLTPADRPTTSI